MRALFVCIPLLLAAPSLRAQAPAAAAAPTETVAPAIAGVVAAGTRVQLLRTGLQGTEGPVAAPDGSLLFTEQNANRITRVDAAGNFAPYLENTGGAIGLAFDRQGRLLAAQTMPALITVLSPTRSVLVETFDGKPLMRPNDLFPDSRGGIYFSDPGPNPAPGETLNLPRKPAVLYRRPDGTVISVAEDIGRPNGVILSLDERVLFVADTFGPDVLAFDVQPDGTLRNRRRFAALEGVATTPAGMRSGADGVALDSEGRLYVATRVGVQVFDPRGQRLGTIPVGVANGPQNIAFAGVDRKTLYVVGRNAAWKIQMLAQGPKDRAK